MNVTRPRTARSITARARTISTETTMSLLDAVSARTDEIMRTADTHGMARAEIQERIMRGMCRRCGVTNGRVAAIPAGKAEIAMQYIMMWQGANLLEG